jgi:hypothetical protein
MKPLAIVLLLAASLAAKSPQSGNQPNPALPQSSGAPASAANVPPQQLADVATLLSKIDQSAQSANLDLARLRIEKWKTGSDQKQASQASADSISRNLTNALPTLTSALRAAPQDMAATFKLYRDLSALNDVFKSLSESAGAFGPKQEYELVGSHGAEFDQYRSSLGDYLEQLIAGKDAELTRLRSAAKTSTTSTLPKKIIVDDTAPVKKKKKKQ